MERITARFRGPRKVQTGGTVEVFLPGIPHDAIPLTDAAEWLQVSQKEIARLLSDVEMLAVEKLAEGKRT